jgi:hypothetical protein
MKGILRQTKSLLKSAFPRGAAAYGEVKDSCRALFLRRDAEVVFSEIYERNLWNDPESVSGRGSTLRRTTIIRRELPALLIDVGAKSLLDAPCGDFNWMRLTELGPVTYVGQWRYVNLQLPPFNFPDPLKLVVEDPKLGKCLGVWRLQQLVIQ